MRRIVAALLAGIVIGSVGMASAAPQWRSGGRTYSCLGSNVSVFCKETNYRLNYEVAIFPSLVTVSYGSKIIYSCKRKSQPQGNCIAYTRDLPSSAEPARALTPLAPGPMSQEVSFGGEPAYRPS